MTETACSTPSFPASMNALVCRRNTQDTAYRVPDPGMCLDTVLCLKYRRRVGRDNTVKYRWRTLQLLPDRAQPSYAGSVVEVLEGLDGRLSVQHEGRTVASQQAPPRPGILRSFDTRTVHTTGPSRYTNGVIRRSGGQGGVNGHNARSGTDSATMLTTTAPQEFAGLRLRDPESPPHYRRRDGRRSRRRSARGCPSVGSPGNWVYTEKP